MAEAGDAVDREGDLNRLRTEIVVAIIPEKDPIPAYKVNKFYREEWRGKDIPYRTYGFHDLDSFLCSLTGAVNMFMIGGEKCYKAATMDSTKHVQQLVQRQKTKTKVKRRPIMRGAYRGSYSSRGMSFAGPARTAPPHLVSAHHVSSQHFNPASSLSE
uniref:Uncharacterized protein n=1 Tax=Plectus sambesii TaxID=2011161 RepID=A0A914VDN5_9BILA